MTVVHLDAMRSTGWFADIDEEQQGTFQWQPCLQLEGGHCPSFDVWFETKAECEEWIADQVLGKGWYPGEPTG